ncbi:MAG TPA: DUF3883 domain-containing protein [Ktedonobacteraceae bacterium]|nr:DUF3883 domain-containing protein [Ktedonobacteraceae bacterium]
MRYPGMNYWAFSGNPRYYRVEDAVREVIVDSWRIPRCDVRVGDRAIIWKAKGNQQRRGIIALAEVLTNPVQMEDLNPHYWVNQIAENKAVKQAKIRYLVSPKLPLWEGETKVLENNFLSVQRATSGSIFLVEPNQWDAIMQEIGDWPASEIEDAELAISEHEGKNHSGQRFRTDAPERQEIEKYAMQAAKTYYEELRWLVTDVSATCSYDLVCRRNNGEELHVEVKGTTLDGQQILLTRNEVEHARYRYPKVALFVLANIKIEQTSTGIPQASGGERHLLEPWNVDEGMLSPLAFAYIVPRKDITEEVK